MQSLYFSGKVLLLIKILVDVRDHRLGVLNTIEFPDLFLNLVLLSLIHLFYCILGEEECIIEVSDSRGLAVLEWPEERSKDFAVEHSFVIEFVLMPRSDLEAALLPCSLIDLILESFLLIIIHDTSVAELDLAIIGDSDLPGILAEIFGWVDVLAIHIGKQLIIFT